MIRVTVGEIKPDLNKVFDGAIDLLYGVIRVEAIARVAGAGRREQVAGANGPEQSVIRCEYKAAGCLDYQCDNVCRKS